MKIVTILIIFTINFNSLNYDYIDKHIDNFISYYEKEYIKYNYYNNESIEEISRKLNKQLNSTLKNKGEFIARYSISKGVDPYLSTAIILHETGCKWTCSKLSRNCNNFGGNKGTPRCGSGRYRKFNTPEEELKFAINNLSNYVKKGLTTPEQIGPKYAGSKTWATKINKYIKSLKKEI